MKITLFILSIICFLIAGLAGLGFTADGDITKAEVRPDVTSYKLNSVLFDVVTQQAVITYCKVDSNGNTVNEDINVIFQNVADNPETPENETVTEFTQLITAINNGSNIKTTITNATKVKLGL